MNEYGGVGDAAYGPAVTSDSGGGAAGYGSGLIGGILDAFIGPVMANVQKGNASKAARRARNWAEYMSNTAYQRTVKDLTAAGLNPILAFGRGPNATPSGPVAQTPELSGLSGAAGRAMSNARDNALFNENIKLIRAQKEKAISEAGTAEMARKNYESFGERREYSEMLNAAHIAERTRRESSYTSALEGKLLQDKRLSAYEEPALRAESALYTEHGEMLKAFEKGVQILEGAAGAVSPFRGLIRRGRRVSGSQEGFDAHGRSTGGFIYERNE